MPPRERDISLNFELHHCKRWQSPADLLETIKLAIDLAQLLPLGDEHVENPKPQLGETIFARPVVKDLKPWFEQSYVVHEEWDTKEFFVADYKEGVGKHLRTTLEESWTIEEPIWQKTVKVFFSAQNFGETYNIVTFSSTLFGKSLTNPESELHWLPDLVAVYQRFAQPVIERLRPEYALITANHYGIYGRDVLNAKLEFIHWCNYFGSTYLQKYGEDLFLGAPGWQVERLGNGIWYQLIEHYADTDEALRQQVLEHFKSAGIKQVAYILDRPIELL